MKPQFTTPCYIRIDDAQQRKEVCEKLQKQGYSPINMAECIDSNYLFAFDGYISRMYGKGLRGEQGQKELDSAGFIQCDSIPLFLDLAAMRSDTAINQWFVYRKKMYNYASCDSYVKGRINSGWGRYATAQEIINYYKQKGEKE